jgi:hypothetical protein
LSYTSKVQKLQIKRHFVLQISESVQNGVKTPQKLDCRAEWCKLVQNARGSVQNGAFLHRKLMVQNGASAKWVCTYPATLLFTIS